MSEQVVELAAFQLSNEDDNIHHRLLMAVSFVSASVERPGILLTLEEAQEILRLVYYPKPVTDLVFPGWIWVDGRPEKENNDE